MSDNKAKRKIQYLPSRAEILKPKKLKLDALTEEMMTYKEQVQQKSSNFREPKYDAEFFAQKRAPHPWESVEDIYKKQKKKIDRNLDAMKDFLRPQAHQIFYGRKVEYLNLVDTKKKHDKIAQDKADEMKLLMSDNLTD